MRKIEIQNYTCPLCNGDLYCAAVDFSYNKETGNRTKTTFKCIACKEDFYSLEEAHEGREPYNCLFCGHPAIYLSIKDDWTDYWKCVPCKVSYAQTFSPYFEGIQNINMYTTIKGSLYVLRQFFDEKKSRIELLPADPEDTVAIAQEFDMLFPNVNPTNIHDKILTYLVFS